MPCGVQKAIKSSSLGSILIWLYPEKPSMKDRAPTPWWHPRGARWLVVRNHPWDMHCWSPWNPHIYGVDHSFPNGKNVTQPSWLLNFTNAVSLYEFVHPNIYFDCQLRTKVLLRVLYWLYAFRNSQLLNSDIWIQAWHILITPSKYVFVFLEELFILCHFFII